MMRAARVRACGTAASALSLFGCGADGFGSEGPVYPDESAEVLTARAALREPACWTDAAPDATISVGASGSVDAQSPDGSYDHDGCPHRFIVDGMDVRDKNIRVSGGSAVVESAGKDWCAGYWSENEARGCRGSPCTWTELGAWSERAAFRASGAGGGACERIVAGALPELAGNHGFTKIRVVTQSGWVYWYRPAYARITVP